jgi:hypothetical protein
VITLIDSDSFLVLLRSDYVFVIIKCMFKLISTLATCALALELSDATKTDQEGCTTVKTPITDETLLIKDGFHGERHSGLGMFSIDSSNTLVPIPPAGWTSTIALVDLCDNKVKEMYSWGTNYYSCHGHYKEVTTCPKPVKTFCEEQAEGVAEDPATI